MNLNTFEKTQQERVIEQEARGESSLSFAQEEAILLKKKVEKRKLQQKKLKRVLFGLSCAIAVLLILVAYSQYKIYTLSQEEKSAVASSTGMITAKTGEEVIKALTRHILLPDGVPQIAEIQDVTKLKESQAFFKDARNGDIVVVYNTTIILYRPSKDIVIGMGDISGVGQQKP